MLEQVILLASHTARSQAYLQVLAAQNLLPSAVILLGELDSVADTTHHCSSWQSLQLPDLSESIEATCERNHIPIHTCQTRDVNTEEVAGTITRLAPDIVVYSGYGGQIVSERILDLGPRFLHLHSGRLPEYRGSTTLYYALLNGEQPNVTAIFLDRHIDKGPIVARQSYPVPPPGFDLDRIYDPAIRADLLARVMRQYATTGRFDTIEHQSPDAGMTYYVVHPVLKHLAILSLGTPNDCSNSWNTATKYYAKPRHN